jgi:hypothetical protein
VSGGRRELAQRIRPPREDLLRLHSAVVTAVGATTVDVRLSGSTKTTPGLKVYEDVWPLADGDTVEVMFAGPDPRVVGRLGAQRVTTPGLWVTVRDKSRMTLEASNARHHADLVRMCDDVEAPPLGYFTAANVDSDFGGSGAFGLSQVDNFSLEYLGWLTPSESGVWQFATDGDDACEIMLDGVVVSGVYGGKGIDGQQDTRLANTKSLVAGKRYLLCYRQEEGAGGAGVKLYYRSPSMVAAAAAAAIVPASMLSKPPQSILPQLKAATFSDWEYVGQRPAGRFGGTPVPFSGGAYNWGVHWDQVGFRRTQSGMVHLRGLIGQDATEDVVFTFPKGYRRPAPPSGELVHNTHYIAANGASNAGWNISVRPNGEISVRTTGTWTDLSSVPPFQWGG